MRDRYRPWLAAVLALVIAGLGHAFLRKWGRAVLWFATILGGAFALTVLNGASEAEAPTELPTEVLLPILFLYLLSAVDAFLVARRQNRELAEASSPRVAVGSDGGGNADGGPEADLTSGADRSAGDGEADRPESEPGETATIDCPNCGKETDADIDFCHWCTEPLPWADGDDEAQKA